MSQGENRAVMAALETILLVLVEKGILSSDEVVLALEDAARALREDADGATDVQLLQKMVRSIGSAHSEPLL